MSRRKSELLEGIDKELIVSSKLIANNTLEIVYVNGNKAVRLHNTDVVTWLPNSNIVLDSGGWRTNTTKDRIREFSKIYINQKKGIWYVKDSVFYDGMIFDKDKNLISPEKKNPVKKIADLKKRIKKFVSLIDKMETIPMPEAGDCFVCKGIMGENRDCLKSHMEEGYLHGTLIFNAVKEAGYPNPVVIMTFKGMNDSIKRALTKYIYKRMSKELL